MNYPATQKSVSNDRIAAAIAVVAYWFGYAFTS
jgi:hypothetical protein